MAMQLRPADLVEIIVLVDNYSDLLLTGIIGGVIRPSLPYGQTLLAEHGLSFLIRVTGGVTDTSHPDGYRGN
jgi:metal-dependent hydrolase (beta-lactamase superfamily II)